MFLGFTETLELVSTGASLYINQAPSGVEGLAKPTVDAKYDGTLLDPLAFPATAGSLRMLHYSTFSKF